MDIVGQLLPNVDETLAPYSQAEQALNLTAGDNEAGRRRESGNDWYGNELDQESQSKDSKDDCNASRQKTQENGILGNFPATTFVEKQVL